MATRVYDTAGQRVAGQDYGISAGGSVAFSFTDTVAGTQPLSQVQVDLARYTASTDNDYVSVKLYANAGSGSSSAPGAYLATLGTILDSQLGTTAAPYTLAVPAGLNLTYGARYWIQLTGTSTSNASVSIQNTGPGTGTTGEYLYENNYTYPDGNGTSYQTVVASVSVGPVTSTAVYDTVGQPIAGQNYAITTGGSYAFSFTDTVAGPGLLSEVRVDLAQYTASTDTGYVSVKLYANSGSGTASAPGAYLATLGTIPDAQLGTSPALYTLVVPNGISLASGTRYWVEVTSSSTSHSSISVESGSAGVGTSGEYYRQNNYTYPVSGGAVIASVSVSPACYCPGTLIRTERGEVPVELLAEGDCLVTLSGAVEPIRWIGRRSYAGRFLSGQPHLHPVRIRAGALADGVPRRDLLVSPSHAMLLDGILVPAECLVNGTTVVRERGLTRVDYLHVELAAHHLIWAEGAASETYVDDDNRFIFHNAHEYARRYPDAFPGPALYAAPRQDRGDAVEAVRRTLAARAARTGGGPARLAG